MGLAAVYGTLRTLRGAVDVASQPGRGSTFRLYLPASEEAPPESARPSPLPTAAARPVRVLVADDEESVATTLRLALEHLSIGAVEAGDGADAWRKLQAGRLYDLILTDINMPLMDGLKLLGLVRAGGLHQRTPVVVITTESAEDERRRARSLGASAYLVKPVGTDAVAEAVRGLLGLQ
jgi:two-component system chemotaxis response regulator CheY